jgi:hypothetical protein
VSTEQLLLLQFPDLNEFQEQSILFLTAPWLLEVLDRRSKKLRINAIKIRTTLYILYQTLMFAGGAAGLGLLGPVAGAGVIGNIK